MRRLGLFTVLLFVPNLALAGSVTLLWDPATGATGYEVEQSVDNMATWTIVADLTAAAACTGTPVQCKTTITAPSLGTVFFRFAAKNAVGRSVRFSEGVWHCQSCAPPLPTTNVGVN